MIVKYTVYDCQIDKIKLLFALKLKNETLLIMDKL